MICRRLALGMVAMLATLVFSAADVSAQEIRYFVVQSSGLFEIVNAPTGGGFVRAPTSEYLVVSGHGTLRVAGYTDRAQRGETVVTQIRGQNSAFVQVAFTPQGGSTQTVFAGNLPLPAVIPRNVSTNTNVDNLTVTVNQAGRVVSRRLPIGSRP